MSIVARVILGATVIAGAACGGQERESAGIETAAADSAVAAAPAPPSNELQVAAVMIGKGIGQNDLITEPTFQFAPVDTVYISVGTTGAPDSAVLTAVWQFQTGKTVDSTSQTIRPEGAQNTEFHILPTKPWQVGTYRVTVYVDGDSADARTFEVRKQ